MPLFKIRRTGQLGFFSDKARPSPDMYNDKSYYEYERLEIVGNPVIKFELVKADNSNNDLRFVSVA